MDPDRRWFIILLIASQIVGALAVVLMLVWMGHFQGGFGWGYKDPNKFNYHPLLMVLGLVFVYGDAILAYRVFRNQTKLYVKILHMLLQLLALIFSSIGLRAAFSSHRDAGMAQLYSVHDWLGLITFLMFATQFALGFVFYLFPEMSESLKVWYMPMHRYWGVTIFCMAIAAALVGTMENIGFKMKTYSTRDAQAYTVNFMALCLVVFGWLVTYLVQKPEYRREPSPSDYAQDLREEK